MSEDTENEWAFALTMQILNAYPDPSHPAKQFDDDKLHLQPPTLLQALHQFAPTPAGRKNIEIEIVIAIRDTQETNSKLEELTSHYWHALLIPCTSSVISG